MEKKTVFFLLIIGVMAGGLYSQSLTQIVYIINKAVPEVKNIAILYNHSNKDTIEKDARTASFATQKKISAYGIKTKGDIPGALDGISLLKNVAVIVIADEVHLNTESVKYTTQKLGLKNIPVVSTRLGDTAQNAFLCVVRKGDNIEIHVNKTVASALKITLTDDFLAECTLDRP